MFTINDKQCDFRKISARTGLRIMALAPAMVNDNNLDSAVKATEAVTEIAAYVWASIKTFSYKNNKFEVEARAAEKD